MDDDWDLHAVVRGCAAALSSTRSTTPNPTPTPHNNALPTFTPNLPFPPLADDVNHPPPPTTTTAAAAVMAIPAGHVYQADQMVPAVQMNMQRFPGAIPQHIRAPRRRKNQQMKLVRQMTQEELSADSWAWRKYGQKPIKGSPYPRNYYRCSTSKGCAARKQVERSPNEAGIFVVSFSGEHTHARPTHRSSLSGSTRTKFVVKNNNVPLLQRGTAPSAPSLSPATASMEAQNDDAEMADEEDDNPLLMNDDEDMFRGFQDSDHSSGGGGDFFQGGLLSSPPWSPGNAATFNGGGGC